MKSLGSSCECERDLRAIGSYCVCALSLRLTCHPLIPPSLISLWSSIEWYADDTELTVLGRGYQSRWPVVRVVRDCVLSPYLPLYPHHTSQLCTVDQKLSGVNDRWMRPADSQGSRELAVAEPAVRGPRFSLRGSQLRSLLSHHLLLQGQPAGKEEKDAGRREAQPELWTPPGVLGQ